MAARVASQTHIAEPAPANSAMSRRSQHRVPRRVTQGTQTTDKPFEVLKPSGVQKLTWLRYQTW